MSQIKPSSLFLHVINIVSDALDNKLV